MKSFFIVFSISCLPLTFSFCQSYTLTNTTVSIDTVTTQVDMPWEILWGTDNFLWVTDGPNIKRLNPITGSQTTILNKPGMNSLGMVLHPNFNITSDVYIVFDTTKYYAAGNLCQLYKYSYSFSGDSLYNEQLILSYPHRGEHAGGRMTVSADNKILLTTADFSFNPGLHPLMGRVLRINLDGSIPSDNPNSSSYEWSKGHRNPQGIVQAPNGFVYSSEHGQGLFPQVEELNIIQPNKNYGWPAFDGFHCAYSDSCNSPTYLGSMPITTTSYAPSGIDYYSHPSIPEFENSLLEGVLWTGQGLVVFNLNPIGDSVIFDTLYFSNQFGRIRDLCVSPDGVVYLITNDRENMNWSANPMTSDAKIRKLYNPNYIPTSSIGEITKPLSIEVYPNPTRNFITVNVDSGYKASTSLEIIDLTGQSCYKSNNSENNILTYDLSGFEKGVYLLKVIVNSEEFVKRVVKN